MLAVEVGKCSFSSHFRIFADIRFDPECRSEMNPVTSLKTAYLYREIPCFVKLSFSQNETNVCEMVPLNEIQK